MSNVKIQAEGIPAQTQEEVDLECAGFVAHMEAKTKRSELSPIFNDVMSAARLVLAANRLLGTAQNDQYQQTGLELITWEAFLRLSSSIESLGDLAGIDPSERQVD